MNRTNKNWILEMMTLKPTRSARASNQESGAQTLGNIGENEGGGELTCAKEEDEVGRDSRAGGAAANRDLRGGAGVADDGEASGGGGASDGDEGVEGRRRPDA